MTPSGWSVVRARDPEGLSPRERECVAMERQGHTRKAIAHRLGISVVTVAGHIWRAGHGKSATNERRRKARISP
jgi:DNA-binding NarL/FixJ family response regulator